MNERSWVLTGEIDGSHWWGRPQKMTEGEPTAVDFDFKFVLKQEEEKGNVIGWLHTHPGFESYTSGRDIRTMKVWSTCMGKPLICAIRGIDGLKAWFWPHDESEGIRCKIKRIGSIFVGSLPTFVGWQEIESNKYIDYIKENEFIEDKNEDEAYGEMIYKMTRVSEYVDVTPDSGFPSILLYPFKCGDFQFYIRYMDGQGYALDMFSRKSFAKNWPDVEKRAKEQLKDW